MATAKEHKLRLDKIRKLQSAPKLKSVATHAVLNKYSKEEVDQRFIERNDVHTAYTSRIQNFEINVSKEEAYVLIESISSGSAVDNILEPVFLSLFDGTMRAFKLGTKQGITASRLYNECKTFSYGSSSQSIPLDSYSESLNERENISRFGEQSSFSNGSMTRGDETLNMRDGAKMTEVKDRHFQGNLRAEDGYGGPEIYQFKKHAKSEGKLNQAGEAEHINSCAVECNRLKSNKALNLQDIKDILNIEKNLLITSMQNNRGKKTGKFDKTSGELQREIEQGFVLDKQGRKHVLSEKELEIRKNMVRKMAESKKSIDSATNSTVINNIVNDRSVQKRLATDAKDAAANQSIGEVVIFMVKPLYYELRDCFINGIEEGVKSQNFKSALTIRFGRMKEHILRQAATLLKDGLMNFFKNFLVMLLEGIVNCFVGIFKQVARMVKEGFKVLLQIAPILRDKNKSAAEKGDAILKLIASSVSIFSSLGIETWLNGLGLGEPWSIIISSILTAVLTALILYLLDKLDLFGVNQAKKIQRIDEIINLKIENAKNEMFQMIQTLS